jgi:hypothetical protein
MLDLGNQSVQQDGEGFVGINWRLAGLEDGRHDFQAAGNRPAPQQWSLDGLEHRLFEEDNVVVGCGARHQMLGALKNEIPAQMGET